MFVEKDCLKLKFIVYQTENTLSITYLPRNLFLRIKLL